MKEKRTGHQGLVSAAARKPEARARKDGVHALWNLTLTPGECTEKETMVSLAEG